MKKNHHLAIRINVTDTVGLLRNWKRYYVKDTGLRPFFDGRNWKVPCVTGVNLSDTTSMTWENPTVVATGGGEVYLKYCLSDQTYTAEPEPADVWTGPFLWYDQVGPPSLGFLDNNSIRDGPRVWNRAVSDDWPIEATDTAAVFTLEFDRTFRDDSLDCPIGGPLYFFYEGLEYSGDDVSGFTKPQGVIDLSIVYRWLTYDPYEFEALRSEHLRRDRVKLPTPGVQQAGKSS